MRKLNRVIAASALAVPMALAASGIAVAADAEDSAGMQDPVGDLLEGTPLEGSSVGNDDSQSLESVLELVKDLENADKDDVVQIGEGNSGPVT